MNAVFALLVVQVLISLLVRLIPSTHAAKSYALHCQHCYMC